MGSKVPTGLLLGFRGVGFVDAGKCIEEKMLHL